MDFTQRYMYPMVLGLHSDHTVEKGSGQHESRYKSVESRQKVQ